MPPPKPAPPPKEAPAMLPPPFLAAPPLVEPPRQEPLVPLAGPLVEPLPLGARSPAGATPLQDAAGEPESDRGED